MVNLYQLSLYTFCFHRKESKSPAEKIDVDTSLSENMQTIPISISEKTTGAESQSTSILVNSSTKKDGEKKKVKFADTAYQEK